ncbi:hypothetical protein Spith_1777 [Spirochaeta thermophila DSM 6578]|uniref:Uncharacterized protein n=1 Tax=Winmispira thermophila (strain ATCC 700085 / DSM 6578 / Z-1203) TaxID=869211 RepID=G0GCH0_WINT7|nr:hypothetical protein [Spirochaeta thermophila]AEJ62036.1 hypothetical protein Spith_1777 [Spirochaeta thermophila DSM 6578]
MRCHACGAPIEVEKVYRSTLCPSCGKEARVCLNCRFYDPNAHWECRETIPERVAEKDRANFCDYFTPREEDHAGDRNAEERRRARKALEDLFG